MNPGTIGEHASPLRVWISPDASLSEASELMQAEGVRHLPVLQDERLVGMLTLSDLYAIQSMLALEPAESAVSMAMSQELYCVSPQTALAQVAQEMAARGIGSAVVIEDERPVAIFTTTDACRVLAQVLRA